MKLLLYTNSVFLGILAIGAFKMLETSGVDVMNMLLTVIIVSLFLLNVIYAVKE